VSGEAVELDTVLDLGADQHHRIALAVLAHEQRLLTRNDLTKAIVKQLHTDPCGVEAPATGTGGPPSRVTDGSSWS